MNDHQLEVLLLSARPEPKEYSDMTKSIMRQIEQEATITRQLGAASKRPRWSLLTRLRTLHGASLVVAIVIGVVIITGVTYASVQFLPELIKVIGKKTNDIGRIEYNAPAFADCYTPGYTKSDKFEVLPSAGISDQDVEKILQAKCELMDIDKFAGDKWPTYGEHKEWKDGDDIFYTRPDILGTVVDVTTHSLTISYDNAEAGDKTYKTFERQELQAFNRGQRIKVSDLKSGDYVFSIVRVSEIYHDHRSVTNSEDGITYSQHDGSPKVLGVVAAVKMSLPKDYYGAKQQYVHPVIPCEGNPEERCTDGPFGSSIDVFPRGGEGAGNPYGRTDEGGLKWCEIGGVVTTISEHQLTIKTGKGTIYTVKIDKSIIDQYNTDDAPTYSQYGFNDAHVYKDSWIGVMYKQRPDDDPKQIAVQDIIRLSLLTGTSLKK